MRLRLSHFLIVGLALSPLGARAVAFHLALEKSEPADKAAVAQPPADLKLWFTESVELPLTKLTLTRGKDTIALGTPAQAKEPKSPVVSKFGAPLTAGAYKVDWRAVGKDGHAVKGAFGFVVQSATTGPAGR